ncbi:MAG TPA: FAD-dependent monooxygenase [Gaiellaceae bacterium]
MAERATAQPRTAQVGIVGGGPVGMSLALFLSDYGVSSVLFNAEPGSRTYPRGNTFNARTMEHFRRVGIAEGVRELGLPDDHPTDVAYFTRYSRHELARIPMPSSDAKRQAVLAAAADDQVPEPVHRANQMYVEAFLLQEARRRPEVTLRFDRTVDELEQDERGVTLGARPSGDDGGRETWRVGYAVGCDGGQSFVRRTLGVHYTGESGLDQEIYGGRATAAYLRIPTLYRDYLGDRRAWNYWSMNAEVSTNLIALNGKDEFFMLTSSVRPDSARSEDLVALVHAAAGAEIPVEVLGLRGWNPGVALVAESYRAGRVFLAGDAAHLFTPTGGFGMNTGIDDAANLAWKLAAAAGGWAGDALLASYEIERRPIGFRNTGAARSLNARLAQVERSPELESDGTVGEEARRRVGAVLSTYGAQFGSIGVQLGARYDDSPVVVADGAEPPADDFLEYRATSVPGGRAPHLWLDEERGPGSSLFDRLGKGFTLLRLGRDAPDAGPLREAARAARIPLDVVEVADHGARDLYERSLVLVRPDQHVAWRGDRPPADAAGLLRTVAGAGAAA